MALEITGKIVKKLPEQTGEGKKGSWVKQDFVIETADQYPKKICCSAWGDKADVLKSIPEGETVKVFFNLESREYNEKWYTDVRAWKIETLGASSNQASNTSDEDPGENMDSLSGEAEDDLPF